MAVTLVKRPLTVEQFSRMIDAGIIPEDERVELIEGDIVEMAPIGRRHAWHVNRVSDLLHELAGPEWVVSVQNPIELTAVSRPQPDVTLIHRHPDVYAVRLPRPEDIVLAVEVADTTVESDRTVKIPLYARAGIAEAWLVDITTDHVEVYRAPRPGGYQEVRRVGPADDLSILAFPGVSFPASRIIGPSA